MCVFLKSLGAASGLHLFGNIQSLQVIVQHLVQCNPHNNKFHGFF